MAKDNGMVAQVYDPETKELRAWSMGARKMVKVVEAGITIAKNGRPRLFGKCSETGCNISKFLPHFPDPEPVEPVENGAE